MCVLWLSSMSTRNPAVCSELNGTANLLMAGYQKCEAAQQSQTRIRYFEKKKTVREVVVLLMLCATQVSRDTFSFRSTELITA